MKVLYDTNIILDLLLNREQFCENSARVIDLSANKVIEGYISASAITDIYYLAYKGIRDKKKVCSSASQFTFTAKHRNDVPATRRYRPQGPLRRADRPCRSPRALARSSALAVGRAGNLPT